mmetsp:Transcript_21106/g.29487  ORF Transcript_21106/g.29487 Transcript_21106/m.29487 type:complete len:434 (+) Transcript_21106:253-1554(+)
MEIENDTIISATTSRRRDDHHPQQHQGNNNNNNNNNWDGKQAGNRRSHPPGMGYRPAVSGILGTTTPPPREGHQQPALAGGRNSLFSLFYRRRGTVHERQAAADGDKSEDAAAEMSHDGKTRAEQQHSLLHVQKVSNGYRGGRGNKKRASVSSSSSSSSPSPFSTSMASSARSRASSSSSSSSRRRRLKNIGWDVIIEDYWRLHSLRRPIASYFLWNGYNPSGSRRTRFWETASGSRSQRLGNPGLYRSLTFKARKLVAACARGEAPKDMRQAVYKIQRDVPRSMPALEYKRFFITSHTVEPLLRKLSSCTKDFSETLKLVSPDLESLNNILLAYCVYDKHMQNYCQGMNYIVACMLMAYSFSLRTRQHGDQQQQQQQQQGGTSTAKAAAVVSPPSASSSSSSSSLQPPATAPAAGGEAKAVAAAAAAAAAAG